MKKKPVYMRPLKFSKYVNIRTKNKTITEINYNFFIFISQLFVVVYVSFSIYKVTH